MRSRLPTPRYALQLLTGHAFTAMGAKVNAQIAAGQVWRLLTPLVLHGSVLHLAFNCFSLHNIGPVIERQFGRTQFLAVYLGAGLGGNFMSYKMVGQPGYSGGVGGRGALRSLMAERMLKAFGARLVRGYRVSPPREPASSRASGLVALTCPHRQMAEHRQSIGLWLPRTTAGSCPASCLLELYRLP